MQRQLTLPIVAVLLFLMWKQAAAQPPPARQLEAMKKFEFLVGDWEGSSWTELVPGQRQTSHGRESMRSKLGGLVVTMEGVHRRAVGEKHDGPIVHNAFAVASFDDRAKKYRFQAYTNRGTYVNAEAKLSDGVLEWGFRVPNSVEIRYVIKVNEKGQWFEKGEMSGDGKSWRKFFEMTLNRVKHETPA
jgi:hypothetical protein